MEGYRWIEVIAAADLLCLLAIVVVFFKRNHQFFAPFRWLYFYLVMVAAVELLSKIYLYWWEGENLYLFHFYTIGEMVLLSIMYLKLLEDKRRMLNLRILLGSVFVVLLSYVGWKLFQPDSSFDMFAKLPINVLMIFMASTFFVRSLKAPKRYQNRFHALFYLNAAVLYYFAGTFIIFMIMNQLVHANGNDVLYLWLLNVVLTLVFHTLCGIVLWKDSR